MKRLLADLSNHIFPTIFFLTEKRGAEVHIGLSFTGLRLATAAGHGTIDPCFL